MKLNGHPGDSSKMKQEFEKAGKLLAFTATDKEMLAPTIDLKGLCNSVDLVNLHTFNLRQKFNDFNQSTMLNTGRLKLTVTNITKKFTSTKSEKCCKNLGKSWLLSKQTDAWFRDFFQCIW